MMLSYGGVPAGAMTGISRTDDKYQANANKKPRRAIAAGPHFNLSALLTEICFETAFFASSVFGRESFNK